MDCPRTYCFLRTGTTFAITLLHMRTAIFFHVESYSSMFFLHVHLIEWRETLVCCLVLRNSSLIPRETSLLTCGLHFSLTCHLCTCNFILFSHYIIFTFHS